MPKLKFKRGLPKRCENCGARYTADRVTSRFCSKPCRVEWGQRAAIRGARAYPLLLEWRRRRNGGKLADVCTLVDLWLADEKRRSRGEEDANAG